MEIFLDTANVDDIVFYKDFIDGVTTNPSLIAKVAKVSGDDYETIAKRICEIVRGPVSVEVTSQRYEEMLEEACKITNFGENICVKLPCTFDGLKVCNILSKKGVSTNVTLCFSPLQALMAARNGATYVSPFVGRMDDICQNGLGLIEDIVNMYDRYGFETRVLAASIRGAQHLTDVALIGVDAVTVPVDVLKRCFEHPLTAKGLEIFERDWNGR